MGFQSNEAWQMLAFEGRSKHGLHLMVDRLTVAIDRMRIPVRHKTTSQKVNLFVQMRKTGESNMVDNKLYLELLQFIKLNLIITGQTT